MGNYFLNFSSQMLRNKLSVDKGRTHLRSSKKSSETKLCERGIALWKFSIVFHCEKIFAARQLRNFTMRNEINNQY